jgi:hypothetical protein
MCNFFDTTKIERFLGLQNYKQLFGLLSYEHCYWDYTTKYNVAETPKKNVHSLLRLLKYIDCN